MGTIIAVIAVAIAAFYLIKRSLEHNKEVEMQQVQKAKADDEFRKDVEIQIRRAQAFMQAGIVGDQRTTDAINAGTYDGPLPEKRDDGGWLSIYDELRILKIAGIRFEHQWSAQEYLKFLEDNGWTVEFSKAMEARIALMYTECRKIR